MSVSVLILTKNEEQDLPACLQSIRWSDDIHVYDSMSTDETVRIAQQFGAHVTQRACQSADLSFGGDEAIHRNWGLSNIPFKHPWVLQLDADERVTPELAVRIQEVVANPGRHVAFRVQRRDYFMDRWLKHVTPSSFNIRLFKPQCITYERVVNPVLRVEGPVGEIASHFDHFPFSKGLADWIDRHNRYSSMEAIQIVSGNSKDSRFSFLQALFSKDRNQRRFHQKELFYRLPLRPTLMFVLLYLGKLGFLDGRAGLTYARLRSVYEYMIVLKARELKQQARRQG